MNEAIALVVLAATLLAAVARPRWAPDWAVAALGAALIVAVGAVSWRGAHQALRELGPTVGFLVALLLLADGCRRAGMFDAVGVWMARGARRSPRRLLAMVFVAGAATTAVLSLDATIVLFTPIVFVTAARLPTDPRPHVYACSHLANTASLLLPVSNLTNLLAFHESGLSFTRFGGLMLLPWLLALLVEWLVLSRSFAGELRRPASQRRSDATEPGPTAKAELPVFALAVLALTLAGFVVSSLVGIAPVWAAAAGALVLELRSRPAPKELVLAAEPTLLVFVLGLGIVVAAAGDHGLSSVVRSVLPHGTGLPALLGIAAISAVAANLVNNLPATLIILPVAVASGPGAVLAMLVGVNVGPNLTYVGSLATLLWRRIVHAHEQETDIGEFTRLGVRTVPAVLLASTFGLWLALQVI
jgi:arsenical pump membrane protein